MNLGFVPCQEVQDMGKAMTEPMPADLVVSTHLAVYRMKWGGVWDKLDCLYVFDKTPEFGLINWKDPHENN